ncbi:MAG: LacI family DNA-binding transcriptional regulator [Victivallaceae bacterium]|nr:LacI family DNA-binding transcriptional regulator [Victivallaceae bacterium]
MGKPSTLRDVAKAANVSPATVSYVINRTKPISEETRRRVLAAAEALHYQPSGRRGKPERRIVAMLHDCMPKPSATLPCFVDEIQSRGYLTEIFFLSTEQNADVQVLRSLEQNDRIAGIINFMPTYESIDLLKWCRGVPSVIYIRDGSALSPVKFFHNRCVSILMEHLVGLGHRKIAFLIDRRARNRPLLRGMIAQFKQCHPGDASLLDDQILPVGFALADERIFAQLDRLRQNGVTAFLTFNARFASHVYQWAVSRSLRIPGDLSVASFEDSYISEWFAPPLTTANISTRQAAALTVDALLAKIENRPPPQEVQLLPILTIRGSTAAPPVKVD